MMVGKIKNIIYLDEDDTLEIVIKIIDKKFQKKLLRDLDLSGELSFEGNKLIYTPKLEKEDANL